jgi:hypothetical protein
LLQSSLIPISVPPHLLLNITAYPKPKHFLATKQARKPPESGKDPGETGDRPSDKDKAQVRRQQVRRAQTQHRQRKANYIKQLELDVCRHREMISAAERDILGLQRENDSIRRILQERELSSLVTAEGHRARNRQLAMQSGTTLQEMPLPMVPQGPRLGFQPTASVQSQQQHHLSGLHHQTYSTFNAPQPTSRMGLMGNFSPNSLTVTLGMDDVLGTPCYQISSPLSNTHASTSQPVGDSASGLPPDQEMRAINLILA